MLFWTSFCLKPNELLDQAEDVTLFLTQHGSQEGVRNWRWDEEGNEQRQ